MLVPAKTVTWVLLILLRGVVGSGGGGHKEHVHFKIYVPEIIKHHIHTKTVFIHVYEEPKEKEEKEKEKPKTHEDHHEEDWSSWKYNHYENTEEHSGGGGDEHSDEHQDHHQDHHMALLQHRRHPYAGLSALSGPAAHFHEDPVVDGKSVGQEDPYPPPTKELAHNDLEPYVKSFEEGYSRGGESKTGHAYASKLTKFHDSKHDEGDHSAGGYENKGFVKTHAGRYLVNEEPSYENERRRRSFVPRNRLSRMYIFH